MLSWTCRRQHVQTFASQCLVKDGLAACFDSDLQNADSLSLHVGQVVESQPRDADAEDGRAVRVSHLTLVDLAGSERLDKTGANH